VDKKQLHFSRIPAFNSVWVVKGNGVGVVALELGELLFVRVGDDGVGTLVLL